MRLLSVCIAVLILSATAGTAEFRAKFEWGDIPLCTNGHPNIVASPVFTVAQVPPGTTRIYFRMKDLDAPRYNHGGGKVAWNGGNSVPAGSFTYKSPCPPGGRHTYEWTIRAKRGSQTLATTKARRSYPE